MDKTLWQKKQIALEDEENREYFLPNTFSFSKTEQHVGPNDEYVQSLEAKNYNVCCIFFGKQPNCWRRAEIETVGMILLETETRKVLI